MKFFFPSHASHSEIDECFAIVEVTEQMVNVVKAGALYLAECPQIFKDGVQIDVRSNGVSFYELSDDLNLDEYVLDTNIICDIDIDDDGLYDIDDLYIDTDNIYLVMYNDRFCFRNENNIGWVETITVPYEQFFDLVKGI